MLKHQRSLLLYYAFQSIIYFHNTALHIVFSIIHIQLRVNCLILQIVLRLCVFNRFSCRKDLHSSQSCTFNVNYHRFVYSNKKIGDNEAAPRVRAAIYVFVT
jgi:hypothetical protein